MPFLFAAYLDLYSTGGDPARNLASTIDADDQAEAGGKERDMSADVPCLPGRAVKVVGTISNRVVVAVDGHTSIIQLYLYTNLYIFRYCNKHKRLLL